MLSVQISDAFGVKQILTTDTPFRIDELRDQIKGFTKNFYVIHNGKLVDENTTCYNGYIFVIPRLFGGKGGFGSMLRAIGAQIEKTTNREACRDLSGRRLRDINEEKRLKAWIEKQGKREEEAAERKKKKLERLCAEPRHEFRDQTYEHERSALTERVGDAVEEGFKMATAGVKRKHDDEFKPNKKKILLDLDIDSDELDTSDDSDGEEKKSEKIVKRTELMSNDSGHSSDENGGSKVENVHSEASLDNEPNRENSCNTEVDKQLGRENSSNTEDEKQLDRGNLSNTEDEKQLGRENSSNTEDEKQLDRENSNNTENEKQLVRENSNNTENEKQLGRENSSNTENEKQLGRENSSNTENEKQFGCENSSNTEDEKELGCESSNNTEDQKQLGCENSSNTEDEKQLGCESSNNTEDQKQLGCENSSNTEDEKELARTD
ncbi:Replication stress response regulator SDE2 [Anthophora retusa]